MDTPKKELDYKEQLEIEKNVKNFLYAFIIEMGHLKEYEDYRSKHEIKEGFKRLTMALKMNSSSNMN